MGLLDRVKEEAAAKADAKVVPEFTHVCPKPAQHYVTEVNKGSIRMQTWQGHLNEMFTSGYRLAHVIEQDGNTLMVFEHSFHG